MALAQGVVRPASRTGAPPTVKTHHRLEYARLAEALAESGLVDQKALKEALQYSSSVGTPFPQTIVDSNLVTDWDLSRVVCDLYGLPFLPVDVADPDPAAFQGLDMHFLRENGLIPIGRYGQVLTICMPGLVEAETLGLLAAQTDFFILPVVGTVRSNRTWLEMNIEAPPVEASADEAAEMSQGWGSFFDEADAQVLMDLQSAVDGDLADVLEPVEQSPDEDPQDASSTLEGLPPALPDPLADPFEEALPDSVPDALPDPLDPPS